MKIILYNKNKKDCIHCIKYINFNISKNGNALTFFIKIFYFL